MPKSKPCDDEISEKNNDQTTEYISIKLPETTALNPNPNHQTLGLMESLSFNGYVLAGNSVANMIEGIKIRGDLDFWVTDKNKYLQALDEFKSWGPRIHRIYPSMIEMEFLDKPMVNLIFSDQSPEQTVDCFDFDYCRCWYTRQHGIMGSQITLDSIRSKTINHEIEYGSIRPGRIIKAIKYGYRFNAKMWDYLNIYLKSSESPTCDQCKEMNNKKYHCNHPIDVKLDDLNLFEFEQTIIDIRITDYTDIDLTCKELDLIFSKYHDMRKNNLILPILLIFKPEQFEYVVKYAEHIILMNPVRNGNYLNLKFIKSRKMVRSYSPNKRNGMPDDYYDLNRRWALEFNPWTNKIYFKNGHQSHQYDLKSIHALKLKRWTNDNYQLFALKQMFDSMDLMDPSIRKINLMESGSESESSYLKIFDLPDDLKKYALANFDQMFNSHPPDRHRIIMFKQEHEVNRWQQSYLRTPRYTDQQLNSTSYMYSGFDTKENNSNLPELFQVFYDHMVSMDNRFNQVVINWYQDENDYIEYHSDCEIGMIPGAEIGVLSLYSDLNDQRVFGLLAKPTTCTGFSKINIIATHGTVISMCGDTQKHFNHGVERIQGSGHKFGPRISISFRQFQD
jgi:alkylated DNA repair dioxygenase AlkB